MLQDNRFHGEEIRKQILNVIVCYTKEHGYPPTFREIGDRVGLRSSSTVHAHVNKMIKEGVLETDALCSPRAIRVPGYKFVKGETVK